jgi:hypothetical protein
MKNTTDRKAGDIVPMNDKIRQKLFNEAEDIEKWFDESFFSAEKHNVEIKTENYNKLKLSGNMFVEFAAKYPERDRPIPSGIETTKSSYWFLTSIKDNELLPISILIDMDYLKKVIDEQPDVRTAETGLLPTGDINYGHLVPMLDILKPYLDTIPPHKLIEFAILRQKEIDEEEVRKQQQIKQRLNELNSQRIKEALNKK